MNATCEKCRTVFIFDDRLIKVGGCKVRCSKCGHIFTIFSPISPPVFEIVKNHGCPLYRLGEEFQLSDTAFLPPYNKAPCLILVKDLMRIVNNSHLQNSEGEQGGEPRGAPKTVFSCSGCTGFVQFEYKSEIIGKSDNYADTLVRLLRRFPIFENLKKEELNDIVRFLKLDRFNEGDFILKKGDFGRYLFIILSGRVDVLDADSMSIASMGKGDIFGEMSLLSGVPVGATIKAMEPTAVLRINGEDFKKILNRFPPVQMNFIRLLVQRVSEINLTRLEAFTCGVTGKLSEIPPSDLLQTFNISEKTGVLTLKFPESSASLSFRDGKLINVRYNQKEGEEAFFELLKQKKGTFKYLPGLPPEEMRASEIGDFMGLLIEGLRRIDEEDRCFLKTVIPTLI